MKALTRDPDERYQDAGAMGYELERYMYHDRFGPTNVTLGRYLRELLEMPEPGEGKKADDVVARRADTIHEDLM